MKTKLTPIPFALLAAALVVLAVACGSAGAKVTVEKGLAAAAAGQEGGTSIGARSAGTPVPYAAAIASKEQAAGSAYTGAAYSPGSVISGGGGGGLLPAPQLQGQTGITVQGYGRATAPADVARVQFVVTTGETYYRELPVTSAVPGEPPATPEEVVPMPAPEGSVEGGTVPPPNIYPTPPSELTEADLAPLINAIKAQGVSNADIEVVIYPAGGYYSPYGSGSAQVTVNLDNPADRVGPLVDAGTQAVNQSGTLTLQTVNVLYTVNDCSALLGEARRAAVEDGRENAQGLASALGVSLGEVLAASEYVSSPLGPSPCEPALDTSPYGYGGVTYDPALPAEVQILSNVALTFAIS